jgi:hypothetical protein
MLRASRDGPEDLSLPYPSGQRIGGIDQHQRLTRPDPQILPGDHDMPEHHRPQPRLAVGHHDHLGCGADSATSRANSFLNFGHVARPPRPQYCRLPNYVVLAQVS